MKPTAGTTGTKFKEFHINELTFFKISTPLELNTVCLLKLAWFSNLEFTNYIGIWKDFPPKNQVRDSVTHSNKSGSRPTRVWVQLSIWSEFTDWNWSQFFTSTKFAREIRSWNVQYTGLLYIRVIYGHGKFCHHFLITWKPLTYLCTLSYLAPLKKKIGLRFEAFQIHTIWFLINELSKVAPVRIFQVAPLR